MITLKVQAPMGHPLRWLGSYQENWQGATKWSVAAATPQEAAFKARFFGQRAQAVSDYVNSL
jgi:hypothetical protein